MQDKKTSEFDLEILNHLKCLLPNHKKPYTHICTKPMCNKTRLYCSKCILLPNNECNGNIIMVEDLIHKNYGSLESWIPDQCIRDLLNRNENDESLKIPLEKDIKEFLNKKLEPVIHGFMEEIKTNIDTMKNDLIDYIIKEFHLRNECFKHIKYYYNCNDILEILRLTNDANKLQENLSIYFNKHNCNNEKIITEAAKIINLNPLKSDHVKSVTKSFQELKNLMNRLIKIDTKKFDENILKLKNAISCITNSNKTIHTSLNLKIITSGSSFGRCNDPTADDIFPAYDQPFNLESFVRKTQDQATIKSPLQQQQHGQEQNQQQQQDHQSQQQRSTTPTSNRSKDNNLVIDITQAKTDTTNAINAVEKCTKKNTMIMTSAIPATTINTPRITHIICEGDKYRYIPQSTKHQRNDSASSCFNFNTVNNPQFKPREKSSTIVFIGERSNNPKCETSTLTIKNENVISSSYQTNTKIPHEIINQTTGCFITEGNKSYENAILVPNDTTSNPNKNQQSKDNSKGLSMIDIINAATEDNDENNQKLPGDITPNKKTQIIEAVTIDLGLADFHEHISNPNSSISSPRSDSLLESQFIEIPEGNNNLQGFTSTEKIKNNSGVKKTLHVSILNTIAKSSQ